jgi:transposase
VANHFREKTVLAVKYDKIRKNSPGTFECPICGYTYMYRASSPHKIKVVKHGSVWENRLLEMVDDQSMTYRSIAKIFSLDHSVIVRHVQKLKNKDLHIEQPQEQKDSASIELRRQQHKEIWEETRKNNPNLSISELARKVPSTYAWLSQNDRQWHNDHKPIRRPLNINWELRDEELLKLAEKTVNSLLSFPRPIMLTRAQILRQMGLQPHGNYLSKIPQTKLYIESCVESHEEFTLRRIRGAAKEFIEEGIIPSKSELRIRAGIKPHWVNRIGEQIDEILTMICNEISQQNNYLNEAAAITDVSKLLI